MEQLTFEPADESDAPIVAEILTEAHRYKVSHNDMMWGEVEEVWTDGEVLDYMNDSTAYLIKQDDEVVATVSLQWHDAGWVDRPEEAGYIHRLALKEGQHGKGLGGKIIDWAAEQVLARGISRLRLDCEAANTKLCKRYEDLGFVRVETREGLPGYGDNPAALYEKIIV